MSNRRHFIKNGLMLILGTGGLVSCKTTLAFPDSGKKSWGLIIDTSRCFGCQSCMVACKLQNHTVPGHFNTRVSEKETGSYPRPQLCFETSICRHCSDAPCVSACTTSAAFIHDSGLVMTDWNRCNGMGDCVDACPYGARFLDKRFENKADKCDLCLHRISDGLAPACVENCSAGARIFGRLDKPEGEFVTYLSALSAKDRKKAAVFIINSDKR